MSTSARPVSVESSVTSLDDIFTSVALESVKQSSAEAPDTAVEETEPSTEPIEETEEEQPEAEPEAPAVPEGYAPVPKIDRPMVAEFTIRDAEGEIEAPDVTITYVANGKIRQDPLDQVVKLAQWGVHNAERHEQAQAAFQEAQSVKATLAHAQAQLAEKQRLLDDIMQSDEKYLDAREAYEKANSPEARLAAKEQELAEHQERIAFADAAKAGQAFMETKLDPAIQTIVQSLPTITEEELAAHLLLEANKFTVHTKYGDILHPSAHQELSKIVLEQLVPWAQATHAGRMAKQQAVTTTAQTQVKKAQVETQKAKNLAAKGMKPVGKAAPAQPQRRAPRNVDEAVDDVLRSTMEAMR